jgi:hypothetical protein
VCFLDGQGILSIIVRGQVIVQQIYTHDEEEIIFSNPAAMQVDSPEEAEPGRYKWAYEDGILTFTLLEDRFDARIGTLSYPWVFEEG